MSRRASPTTILAVLAFGVFVAADDLTVVSTMLRQIIFDLGIPLPEGLNDAAWIVNAYLIAYIVVMPFVGRVSDILGRRAVYIGSLILFLAGSIWVPFAHDLPSFLVGRVLTALGGGAMVPVSMAIIADTYAARKRASALGTLGAIDTAGWVWGPLYGALLIRFLDWRWQFYLNIPLSLLGIAAAWWALRDLPRPQRGERLDWFGAAVLSIALISLNVALLNSSGNIQGVASLSELSGDSSGSTLPLYGVAAVTLLLFAVSQWRLGRRRTQAADEEVEQSVALATRTASPAPLIDPALFGRRNFNTAVIVNFLVGGTLIIAMVNVPLVINILELEPRTAALLSGYLLSSMTVSMAIMAYVGGRLTEKFSYRPVTVAGLLFCAAGFGLMGSEWTVDTSYWQMAWQLAVLGFGLGLVTAPIGAAVINAAPDDQRGIAASLVIVVRLIGMSVGLSGLTAWGLRRFSILRTQITLPDLPFTDPAYQQAVVDGLRAVTVRVLTETFWISAAVALLALLFALRLRKDQVDAPG